MEVNRNILCQTSSKCKRTTGINDGENINMVEHSLNNSSLGQGINAIVR